MGLIITQIPCQHCSPSDNKSLETPFAPHNEHVLIDLVGYILDYAPGVPAPKNVHLGPLKMILGDLYSMRWFWKRWGDGSTSIASTALQLVSATLWHDINTQ